jgi:F0F1-type ATP synthase assembly protein I
MEEDQYSDKFRSHNVVATFDQEAAARAVMDQLEKEVSRDRIRIKPVQEEPAVDFAKTRDEVEGVVAGPGVSMSTSQAQGAFGGSILFAIVGAVVGVVAGFIWHSFSPEAPNLLVKALIGALCIGFGAGTFGFQAGGSFKPRSRPARDRGEFEGGRSREGVAQTRGKEGRVVVEVRTDESQEFLRAVEILERANPSRLDTFNEQGEVISTKKVGGGKSDAEGPPPGRDLGV